MRMDSQIESHAWFKFPMGTALPIPSYEDKQDGAICQEEALGIHNRLDLWLPLSRTYRKKCLTFVNNLVHGTLA